MKKIIVFALLVNSILFGYQIKNLLISQNNYKNSKVGYGLASYAKALDLFNIDFGHYPDELKELFYKPRGRKKGTVEWPKDGYFRPGVKPIYANVVKDPWNNDYIYRFVDKEYVLYSWGADTEDSEDNIGVGDIDPAMEKVYEEETKASLNELYKRGIVVGIIILIFMGLIIAFSLIKKPISAKSVELFNDVMKNFISLIIRKDMTPPLILHHVTMQVARLFPTMRCAILVIKDTSTAYSVASQDNPDLKEFELNLVNYPEIVQMLTRRDTVIVDQLDVITESNILASVKDLITDKGIKAILIEPIVKKEKIVGTLFIRTTAGKRTFTSEEIEICKLIAKASQPILEKHGRYKELYGS